MYIVAEKESHFYCILSENDIPTRHNAVKVLFYVAILHFSNINENWKIAKKDAD